MASPFEPSPLSRRRSAEEEDRDRDLGFGSTISRESRRRLLNRDGSFNVVRSGLGILETIAPYHQLLSMSWTRFFGLVVVLYVVFNLAFAVAFVACGADALQGAGASMLGGRFSQAFFFSVQTFATIGYGQIGPNGFAANMVVTVEALVGLMYQALATGLMFARFARPSASILFSNNAIVAPYGDGRALMFRIVNRRRNEIIHLGAQVLFSAMEPDARGAMVRRYVTLPLERNTVTFFPLFWTIVHPVDASSPLAGKTSEELAAKEAEILVLLSGTDQTSAQTIHTRSSYLASDIVWNARFTSMSLRQDPEGQSIDITRVHDIERLPD